MKKLFSLIFCLFVLSGAVALHSQEGKDYTVMFYNVENLFDIYDDPMVADEEFTPDGPKDWTEHKYREKISHIGQVIFDIAKANASYPAIIGVSEVENRRVLDDLVSVPDLLRANYQIVHYDSPEARGIDVALIYRPDIFKYEWSKPIRPVIPEWPDFRTRDILAVFGTIDGEEFCFFVNHWSSRRGGSHASEYLRCGCAATLKRFTDSLSAVHPDVKIVIMGDMNDDPDDRSLTEVLGGKAKPELVQDGEFFNPFISMHKAGYGTLGYQDAWNLFDNILVSKTLLEDGGDGQLRIRKAGKGKYYGNIFRRPYLIQQKGKFKNYPFRTFSGNTYLGGYSDHLPVYILIGK